MGHSQNDINCSEYLHKVLNVKFSPAPYFDLEEEYALQQKLSEAIHKKMIRSAHDISEGGLFVTLCESGFNRELGFSVITNNGFRKDAWLFGEAQSRVLVSVELTKVNEFEKFLGNFPFEKIGVVTAGEVVIDGRFLGHY